MSGGSLWEREHLRPRDLPSLQEVLGACDRSLLRRVIIEDFAEVHACADKARRNAMAQRLDGSLDAMASLEVRRGPTRGWVLAPRESYVLDARGGTLTWRLHAALVPLLNVAAAECLVRVAQMPVTTYAQARKVDKRLIPCGARGGREGQRRRRGRLGRALLRARPLGGNARMQGVARRGLVLP